MKKKRLIFIAPKLHNRGGQERSSLEVLTRLAENGWDVSIMSLELSDWPKDLPVSWICIPNLPIPTQLLKNIYFSIFSFFKLLPFKDYLKITIGSASYYTDIRVIQFVHGAYLKLIKQGNAPFPNQKTIVHRFYQWIYLFKNSILEKILYPNTKHLIAISHTVSNSLSSVKGKTNISVIHHAPDRIDKTENSFSNDSGPVKLLFVGALERKGIRKVIRVMSELSDQEWSMDIVGDGNIEELQAICQVNGILDKMHFHGVKQALPFFKDADIFFFPSTYEPYGLVVSEAASAKCALVVSNECGATELWPDRPSWLNLSAMDDDKKWQEAIYKLIVQRELREDMQNKSFHSFAKYDWDQAAKSYEKVFESYLL